MRVRDGSITFTVAGKTFELDRAGVEARVDGLLPDPIKEHYVVVAGRRFPPKQVLELATGVDRADFPSHHARRILRRLGFAAGRKGSSLLADPADREGPHDGRQAEALRPYVGKWVALKGPEVLVAADTPEAVVEWLERHDVYADGMFRVPTRPEEAQGAGPS